MPFHAFENMVMDKDLSEENQDSLGYADMDALYRKMRVAYITYMNFGWDSDYEKFRDYMSDYLSLLTAKLMSNQSYHGAGDVLFAGVLYQLDRQFSSTLSKPMNLSIEGLNLTLTINPVLFFMYYEGPKRMLAGIRQMCYHIIFNHLTDYDWAYKSEADGKMMSVAMEMEINQYINNLPQHSLRLDWLRDLLDQPGLKEKQGSLYYFQQMKAAYDDPKHRCHDRVWSTFEHMKGTGAIDDTYSQLSGNFDPKKTKELRIDSMEQLNNEMKKNLSVQMVIPDSQNNDLHRQIIDGIVRKAYQNLDKEMRERMSGNIKERVTRLVKQRSLNWRSIIKKGLGSAPIPYDFSKNRANRRQPFRIDLPGRVLATARRMIAFIDTSASQNKQALNYSLAELANINKTLGTDIWVVQVDTKVVQIDRLDQKTLENFSFKGRGGTSFAPAYQWLHDNGFNDENSVAVYFTDGYGDDGFERYGYHNMYWILTDADPKEASPLSTSSEGKLLYLRADEKYNHYLLNQLKRGASS